MNTSRDIAVSALSDRAGNVTAHLDRLLDGAGLSGADNSFARELALGTVRRKATLTAVLRAFLSRPDTPLPPALANIFHVALYQVLFLDRVPAFAAVDEAVKQARTRRFATQSGMVNGLLRTIVRSLGAPQKGKPPTTPKTLPTGADAYREFDKAVFPDATVDATAYIAAAYSLPADLAKRWVRRGGLAGAAELGAHANARAPFIVRVNRLKADRAAAKAALAAEGVECVEHANGLSLVLTEHANIAALAAFKDGLVQPQDPTATGVGLACGVAPGMNVLDFCAAPGTKTTHLAEVMGNQGSITAVDVSKDKLDRIEDNCRRLGVTIVRTMLAPDVGPLPAGSFDVVLADVPCSNTGVLARRAEARWQFNEKSLSGLSRDQRFLASVAASFVKPGGRLVYSTCSVEPEENEQVATSIVKGRSGLKLIRQQSTLPGGADDPSQWHDGGYHACFSR